MTTIGVTGATGAVGGGVARRLASQGRTQRLLVRDPRRAPDLPGAHARRFDFADPDPSALEELDVLLLVSAAEAPDRLAQHLAAVDAAAQARVGHVVYLSFLGAAPDAVFTLARDHAATEEHLRATGLPMTVLRDSFYADVLPWFADADGRIAGPAGEGRFAPVTRDDVADCAAAVLSDPAPHAGRTYDLTGPEALTMAQAAAVLAEVTGRPCSFVDQDLEQARASRAVHGVAEWQLQAWISTYTAIAAGELDVVSGDVALLSGHAATPLRALRLSP